MSAGMGNDLVVYLLEKCASGTNLFFLATLIRWANAIGEKGLVVGLNAEYQVKTCVARELSPVLPMLRFDWAWKCMIVS